MRVIKYQMYTIPRRNGPTVQSCNSLFKDRDKDHSPYANLIWFASILLCVVFFHCFSHWWKTSRTSEWGPFYIRTSAIRNATPAYLVGCDPKFLQLYADANLLWQRHPQFWWQKTSKELTKTAKTATKNALCPVSVVDFCFGKTQI